MKLVYKNATVLSAAHFVGYVIPLLEVPVLARALGPEVYGEVVFLQSLALLSSLVVEYGFNLSAARQVAQMQNDHFLLRRIFGDVFLAKLILSILVVTVAVVGGLAAGSHIQLIQKAMVIPAAVYFCAFAFSPFWYFQGRERMIAVVVLELVLRLIGLGCLFVFIKDAEDGILALAIMSSIGLMNTVIASIWCLQQIGIPIVSFSGAVQQIRQGFHVFLYRSANNMLLSAASPVLGYFSGPLALSAFVPAEKVVRGAVGFAMPILTALFPYFARNAANNCADSARHAWFVIFLMAIVGLLGAGVLWLIGPMLVQTFLGDRYAMAANLLNWFVWLIPLRMTSQALGMILLIPARKDKAASSLLVFFSVIALGLGGGLAASIGAIGMVAGFLAAEASLMLSLAFVALQVAPDVVSGVGGSLRNRTKT